MQISKWEFGNAKLNFVDFDDITIALIWLLDIPKNTRRRMNKEHKLMNLCIFRQMEKYVGVTNETGEEFIWCWSPEFCLYPLALKIEMSSWENEQVFLKNACVLICTEKLQATAKLKVTHRGRDLETLLCLQLCRLLRLWLIFWAYFALNLNLT